ncbi:MAG: transaldolase [Kineosporiaceae bacterium]|nr:transaldolase [Kineosporiaceae bacterium]
MSTTRAAAAALSAAGVSIWLDDLSRELLDTGELARLVAEDGVVGVTSNPTIFASALAKGDRYTDQVRALAERGVDVDEAVFQITTDDVRAACDLLRPVYEATDGLDGRVSIEVDPRLAGDTVGTLNSARRLWATVDRPNAMIKIPATLAGLPAITAALGEGISVNVTLIFSLDRYRAVMNAWLEGLETALAAGRDLSTIASVASFFVSRVDGEFDRRLTELGTPQALALRGEAALANARLAYQAYEEVTSTARWQTLAAEGARPQRPLWASTGVKNPDYPDTMYVSELVAPGTVNTMPGATLAAVLDHGPFGADGAPAPDTVSGTADEAGELLDRLAGLGVDYADVVDGLEREGVRKFVASWDELVATVSDELARAAALDEGESEQ